MKKDTKNIFTKKEIYFGTILIILGVFIFSLLIFQFSKQRIELTTQPENAVPPPPLSESEEWQKENPDIKIGILDLSGEKPKLIVGEEEYFLYPDYKLYYKEHGFSDRDRVKIQGRVASPLEGGRFVIGSIKLSSE